MSKRKLIQLVNEKLVNGWDDLRMLTISGLHRRGTTQLTLISNNAGVPGSATTCTRSTASSNWRPPGSRSPTGSRSPPTSPCSTSATASRCVVGGLRRPPRSRARQAPPLRRRSRHGFPDGLKTDRARATSTRRAAPGCSSSPPPARCCVEIDLPGAV